MDEVLHQVLTALRGMWRRRWIGLAVAWAVAVIGAIVLLRIPDRYEATARVFVDTQTVLKPLMAGLAVQPNVDEQISMLARTLIARPNIEKIIRSTDLDVTATTQIEKDRLVDSVTQRIKFLSVGRENIYSISFQDVNPDRAKRVVQDLLSLFVESGVGNKRRDSETARRFIDEQIKAYEKKLEEAENRVKEFKIRNVGFTGGGGQDYFTRMNALTEEAAKARLELRAAEESRDALKRELVGEDPVMLPDTASAGGMGQASEFDARIADQKKLLDELMRRYTDQHPDVVVDPAADRATRRPEEAGIRGAPQGGRRRIPASSALRRIRCSRRSRSRSLRPRPTSRRCARGSARARRGWRSSRPSPAAHRRSKPRWRS